ncbi:MAG: SUMF1/EgtB/PvdO family nonheme iron enzyme [Verrucomicrobiales bacterium]|nr:SUMF1/EgtB/PvdO family nonheme iron enzyme [Verrucomicrobiales bacterium]
MKSCRRILLAYTLVGSAFFTFMSTGAERVALVVGNGDYSHATKLANPPLDAVAIESLLKQVGFEVLTLRDANVEGFYEGLEQFKTKAKGAKVGLFYFAGHGVEVDGENYLLPVDAELSAVPQLRTQAVSLETVLDDMEDVKLAAKMVILDCCRDNPLPTRSWLATRSAGGGLQAVADGQLPPATMIMFASAPGKVALDGAGANSPFTKALVEQLGRSKITAFDAFLAVSDNVALVTKERQIPWIKFDGAGRRFRMFSLNEGASIDVPIAYTNSLGMRFMPVPGADVFFCEHETRVKDYAAFAAENPGVNMRWKNIDGQTSDHPVVQVSWEEAKAFCKWLSRKERRIYRLPTDHEWSLAVGIGDKEDASLSPEAKNGKVPGYPWGNQWPPPEGTGNLGGMESTSDSAREHGLIIKEYTDEHPFTAPVKSYSANENRLFDMGGNVTEWCEDWFNDKKEGRVLRGSSWWVGTEKGLRSSMRIEWPSARAPNTGFRAVVELE